MNAGKLVAQIAVLAIVVYCCYGAIADAVPTDMNELQQLTSNPIEFNSPTITPSMEGMTVMMTVDGGDIVSHLPQDISDVFVNLYIGSGDSKINIGRVAVGTLVPNVATDMHGVVEIPVYMVMAYAICSNEGADTMVLPLCMELGFKYFKWQGYHLLDLAITMKFDMPIEGASVPTATVSPNGEDVEITLDLNKISGGDLVSDVTSLIPEEFLDSDDSVHISIGDAELTFKITEDSSGTSIAFSAFGDDGKNAAELIKAALNDDGTLDVMCDGLAEYNTNHGTDYSIPPLSKENAQIFIDLINSLYEGAA